MNTLDWKINSCIFLYKNPITLLFGIVSRDSIFLKFFEVTSRHSCVHWCFALKGQWHKLKDFLLQVFFRNHRPPSLWKSANLCTYKICYICGPSACVAICRFAIFRPNIFWQFVDLGFADQNLKIPQICKFFIFRLTNTYLNCTNANFYLITNSAIQICSRLLDSFAIKENLWWEICEFAICGLAHQLNLQICNLQFADQSKLICRLAYLRNLRICNCRLSPRIWEFRKKVAQPSLQICHRCQYYRWQIATSINNTSGKLAKVVHLELQIFPRIFEQIGNDPNRILRGLGEADSWKNPEVENLIALSL